MSLERPAVATSTPETGSVRRKASRGAIVIEVFCPTPVPAAIEAASQLSTERRTSRSRERGAVFRRFISGAVGSLASLTFHALLLGSLAGGGSRHTAKPPDTLGSSQGEANARNDDDALQWVAIDTASSDARPIPSQLQSLAATFAPERPQPLVPTQFPEPQIEIPSDTGRSSSANSSNEVLGSAQLYGLYEGQIDARIERAWLRPRSALDAASFSCQVRVEQSPDGRIANVTLEECNGDERWQRSLVDAIASASPLPAPPDPSVFARTLRLRFEAQPYVPGRSASGYEPVSPEE